jgi:hypothetical protein
MALGPLNQDFLSPMRDSQTEALAYCRFEVCLDGVCREYIGGRRRGQMYRMGAQRLLRRRRLVSTVCLPEWPCLRCFYSRLLTDIIAFSMPSGMNESLEQPSL